MNLPDLAPYQQAFSSYLSAEIRTYDSAGALFAPIQYILSLEGKRIRPLLTLISYQLFKEDFPRSLPQAMAIETFHNFTLMHDDIMDAAPTRRGHASVHVKYDLNSAILSGDAMLILSYQYLSKGLSPSQLEVALSMFSNAAMSICAGQQDDMDFESQDQVSIDAYLNMIRNKTAILLGLAMALGGISAEVDNESITALADCGVAVGMAFQIHDDYLDAFGDHSLTGKQVGGDIIQNKKTYLWLKASALGGQRVTDELAILAKITAEPKTKVSRILEIYRSLDLESHCQALQQQYTSQAIDALNLVSADNKAKQRIFDLMAVLLGRQH